MFRAIYAVARVILQIYYKIVYFVRVSGLENVPKDSGFILACNHTSNHDPVFVIAHTPRHLRILAKKELFKVRLFAWFLRGVGVVPIQRGDITEISTLKTIMKLLKEKSAVMIFPEGTRHMEKLEDVKSGSVLFAIKTKVPIVPMAITGNYKPFHKMKVTYGAPIYYDAYYDVRPSQETLHQLSIDLMKQIYAMRDGE